MSGGSWVDSKTTDGSTLIFTPAGLRCRKRPVVTLGTFGRGRGDVAVHFRQYAEQSPGVIAPTRDGCSLTLAELEIVVERLRRMVGAVSEAA